MKQCVVVPYFWTRQILLLRKSFLYQRKNRKEVKILIIDLTGFEPKRDVPGKSDCFKRQFWDWENQESAAKALKPGILTIVVSTIGSEFKNLKNENIVVVDLDKNNRRYV